MIDAVTDATQAWRVFNMTECAVVMGMSALILKKYIRITHARKTDTPLFVALAALSYILLCVYVLVDHIHRLIAHEEFTFRLVLGPISYTIGIYALTRIIVVLREVERSEHPLRRHYDPLDGEA